MAALVAVVGRRYPSRPGLAGTIVGHGMALDGGWGGPDPPGDRGRVLHRAPLRRFRLPEQPPVQQAVQRDTLRHPSPAAQVSGAGALDGGAAHGAGDDHRLDPAGHLRVRPDLLPEHQRQDVLLLQPRVGTVLFGGAVPERDRHLHRGLRRRDALEHVLPAAHRLGGVDRLRHPHPRRELRDRGVRSAPKAGRPRRGAPPADPGYRRPLDYPGPPLPRRPAPRPGNAPHGAAPGRAGALRGDTPLPGRVLLSQPPRLPLAPLHVPHDRRRGRRPALGAPVRPLRHPDPLATDPDHGPPRLHEPRGRTLPPRCPRKGPGTGPLRNLSGGPHPREGPLRLVSGPLPEDGTLDARPRTPRRGARLGRILRALQAVASLRPPHPLLLRGDGRRPRLRARRAGPGTRREAVLKANGLRNGWPL